MKTKKILVLLLCLTTIITVTNAQNPSGECGDEGAELSWEFNIETGLLTIKGTGKMLDSWGGDSKIPWYKYKSDITAVSLPNGLSSIGDYAFYNCKNLDSIAFPASVKSIGYRAFRESGLTSVTIPATVTFVDLEAFHSCHKLKSVDIQSTMSENSNKIAGETFYFCTALESLTIAEGIERIAHQAFGECSALKELVLPSTTYLMDESFQNCTGLESITCYAATPPICHNSVFENVTKSIPVYVPNESVETYQDESWEEFTNFLPIYSTSIETVHCTGAQALKRIENGKLLIEHDGKLFDAKGAEIMNAEPCRQGDL